MTGLSAHTAVSLLATAPFDTRNRLLAPLINGLFDGSAYGLLALGLVLLYKSDRIFNFAQIEFASLAGVLAYNLRAGTGALPQLPYGLALLLGVVGATLAGALTQLLVIRPLAGRPRVVLVVATVGVTLALLGLEGTLFATQGFLDPFGKHLGLGLTAFSVDGVPVPWTSLAIVGALVVLAGAAFAFFRFTLTGTAILAASQDATAARAVGISVQRLSLLTWTAAGFLGGVAGVFYAQTKPVVPGFVTGLALVPAFTAAVIGGMTSLPGAFVGGVLLGLFQDYVSANTSAIPGLASVQAPTALAVFLVLLIMLLVRPSGLLGKEA